MQGLKLNNVSKRGSRLDITQYIPYNRFTVLLRFVLRVLTHNHTSGIDLLIFVWAALPGAPFTSEVLNGITYPLPNFNGCTVEDWEWITNFIPYFIMDVTTYPCYWKESQGANSVLNSWDTPNVSANRWILNKRVPLSLVIILAHIRHGVSNYRQLDWLFNRFYRLTKRMHQSSA